LYYLHHIINSSTNYLTEDDGLSNISDFMKGDVRVKNKQTKFIKTEKATKISGKTSYKFKNKKLL